MYRNYNGQGSAFGETGVRAASADQSQLAIYAAQRTQDYALTLLVINKVSDTLTTTLAISGFSATGLAQVYRYSSQDITTIQHLPDQSLVSGNMAVALPGASITLFVLPSTETFQPNLFLPLIRR
jgi:hypothetical protein